MNTASFLMRVLMSHRMEVWSWGIHNVSGYENGLEFNVQGFKFNGKVIINYNQGLDLWDIDFVKRGKVTKNIEGVYTEDLVSIIDNYVEYTGENYKTDVKEWLQQAI